MDDDELKKVYRRLALKHHPDRQNSDESRKQAHDEFSKIAAAYNTISDPVKRYDWKQANEEKLKKQQVRRPRPAPAGIPKKQMPASSVPSRPSNTTATDRSRSTSPKRNMSRSHAPPPPTGVFSAFRKNPKKNPHSQHPIHKQRQAEKTDIDASSRATAPSGPDRSQSPATGSREAGLSQRPLRRKLSTTESPRAGRRVTNLNTSDHLKSPPVQRPRRKTSLQPPSSAPAGGIRRKAGVSSTRPSPPKHQPAKKVPQSASGLPSQKVKSSQGLAPAPNLDDSSHAPSVPSKGRGNLRRPRSMVSVTSAPKRSNSDSPRPGKSTVVPPDIFQSPDPRGMKKAAPKGMKKEIMMKEASRRKLSEKECHDPYAAFERKLKEHFVEDYQEGDWKKKGGIFGGSSKKRVIHAKTTGDPDNPNTVVSMTTSSKKERRKDDTKLYDIKTVTKLLKVDGSVEKIRQASIVDKAMYKKIDGDTTITITREKLLAAAAESK